MLRQAGKRREQEVGVEHSRIKAAGAEGSKNKTQ